LSLRLTLSSPPSASGSANKSFIVTLRPAIAPGSSGPAGGGVARAREKKPAPGARTRATAGARARV
jgi:hypothetical protein